MKTQLRALIEQGLTALRAAGTLPADLASPDFSVERPKERTHGDFSTNAAMLLAKAAKTNPRALAQQLVNALPASDAVLQDIAAAERDYEQAKFRGFTEDELRQYTALERRVQENEKQILQK